MSDRKPCRWMGSGQPRAIRDEHVRDCNASGCPGCKPCPDAHCMSCGHRHLTSGERRTCATCVGTVRDDLDQIETLSSKAPKEAEHRGVNSEAAMLAGPSADPAAWGRRASRAMLGHGDAGYLEDCRDELHPLWVLGSWEMLWRSDLGHYTEEPLTLAAALDYLRTQLSYMAQRDEPDFEQFAAEVRACRGHLEDVMRDGERDETGAPCPMCGNRALVKWYGDKPEDDRWECPGRDCTAWYTEADYRAKVEGIYVHTADRLTASQMRDVYRVPEGSVRGWAALGKVRKRGKDRNGITLYDVGDTLAMRDGSDRESA